MSKNNNMIIECTRLFSYARPHWKMVFLTLVCMGIFTLLIGAQLALIKPVIDHLVKGEVDKSTSAIHSFQKKNGTGDLLNRMKQKTATRMKKTHIRDKT